VKPPQCPLCGRNSFIMNKITKKRSCGTCGYYGEGRLGES